MGFFDKKSKKRTTITETNTNNVDSRSVDADEANIGGNVSLNFGDIKTSGVGLGLGSDGGGGQGAVGDISVSTTDFGALDAATDIAGDAVSELSSAVQSAIGLADSVSDNASALASEATRDESARTNQMLIVGAVVVGLAFIIAVRRGKK